MDRTPTTVLLYIAIAGLVFYKVIYSQLRGTLLSVRGLALTPVILLGVGGYYTLKALPGTSAAEFGLLIADVVVLTLLGLLRSSSTKLTSHNGYAFQKGSGVTVALWVLTIGVRVGFVAVGAATGVSGPLTSASIALTLGISIGAQNALTYVRARQRDLRMAADKRELADVR
ncbi:hypothetical protein [Amycolatopsis sp. H20-H5]|uniref:hypothetical protein n=1 Tax=Amycolatopsis sp. H20-H5 TaxID=3046309 RepID=UPI002DBB1D5F|nr:hypothetical protein [Amycolatopsis sp. H20-H5]MEC3975165.1 hypothetical protein [Amycolatopsis sp. H20-H5]